jgi:hypothetical protein
MVVSRKAVYQAARIQQRTNESTVLVAAEANGSWKVSCGLRSNAAELSLLLRPGPQVHA